MKKFIPNGISLLRGLIIAPLVLLYTVEDSLALALVLYLAGGLSDGLDGFLARRLNATSNFGKKYLDPSCDFLLEGAAYLGLALASALSWRVFAFWAGASCILGYTTVFAPPRYSRRAEGIGPFWGVGMGIFAADVYAARIFSGQLALISAATAALAIIILRIKIRRVKYAISLIRQKNFKA